MTHSNRARNRCRRGDSNLACRGSSPGIDLDAECNGNCQAASLIAYQPTGKRPTLAYRVWTAAGHKRGRPRTPIKLSQSALRLRTTVRMRKLQLAGRARAASEASAT